VQVQLLPDTLAGLVAQPAEHLSLKQGAVGSTPTGATGLILGVSSNGKTAGLHPADEGSIPSTVHFSIVRWWKGRHAVLRRPCPTGREGSTPSLATARWRGSSAAERRALNPDGDGSNPSPAAFALVVKRTSWLPPKEQVQVQFLAGVLTDLLRW
jgi:hypothetical protein